MEPGQQGGVYTSVCLFSFLSVAGRAVRSMSYCTKINVLLLEMVLPVAVQSGGRPAWHGCGRGSCCHRGTPGGTCVGFVALEKALCWLSALGSVGTGRKSPEPGMCPAAGSRGAGPGVAVVFEPEPIQAVPFIIYLS